MAEWIFIALVIAGFVLYQHRKNATRLVRHSPEAPPGGDGWTNLAPQEFVVVDLETTGLDASKHKIIEVGAILVKRDQLAETKPQFTTFHALIRIEKKLPKKIIELTGINDDLLAREGVMQIEAIKGLIDFAGNRPFVAFNAPFDRSFLLAAANEHGLSVKNRWICALEKARNAWPGQRSYKLSALTRSTDVTDSHRALADAQRALIVYASALKS